jgi:hypothetical protein
MTTVKKKGIVPSEASVLEQMRDIGGSVTQSFSKDLVGGVVKDALTEIFSAKPVANQKDLMPGEEIFFPKEAIKEATVSLQPNPITRPETTLPSNEEITLAREIETVRYELKIALKELKSLTSTVDDIEDAVSQTPVKVGKYHRSFFNRLRQILKLFRQQISESRTWLDETFAKKRKRQFWAMFKKHGTSYGLSSERVVAASPG